MTVYLDGQSICKRRACSIIVDRLLMKSELNDSWLMTACVVTVPSESTAGSARSRRTEDIWIETVLYCCSATSIAVARNWTTKKSISFEQQQLYVAMIRDLIRLAVWVAALWWLTRL